MNNYIPTDNNGRVNWSLNFENKFPNLSESLGINDLETQSLLDDSQMMRFVILNSI